MANSAVPLYCRADAESPGGSLEAPNTPVSRVHTDYTTRGGISRLKALLPDEADRLSSTPFAIYQVINGRPGLTPGCMEQ